MFGFKQFKFDHDIVSGFSEFGSSELPASQNNAIIVIAGFHSV